MTDHHHAISITVTRAGGVPNPLPDVELEEDTIAVVIVDPRTGKHRVMSLRLHAMSEETADQLIQQQVVATVQEFTAAPAPAS